MRHCEPWVGIEADGELPALDLSEQGRVEDWFGGGGEVGKRCEESRVGVEDVCRVEEVGGFFVDFATGGEYRRVQCWGCAWLMVSFGEILDVRRVGT